MEGEVVLFSILETTLAVQHLTAGSGIAREKYTTEPDSNIQIPPAQRRKFYLYFASKFCFAKLESF